MYKWSIVSDVEGNWNYWIKFISISQVLQRENDGKLSLKNNCGFIFGGDSVDKGNGDIRIVKDLLQLKEDYPERVYLIIGNRDSCKLRFTSESGSKNTLHIPIIKRLSWFPSFTITSYDDFIKIKNLDDNIQNRVYWMLAETMGAVETFQFRKEELEILGLPFEDENVAHSFINSVLPDNDNNFMLKYLKNADYMVRIGNTVFVHGGINDLNLGTVPGDEKIRENIDEWLIDLNKWKNDQINEYENNPNWNEYPTSDDDFGKRGANDLMYYGIPGGHNDKTIVYSYHLPNGNPENLSEKTSSFLFNSGINRIIVGHQPHGDCPTMITTNDKVQVVTCDTSYSDVSKKDNRGLAVSEVILYEEDQVIEVHGILKDAQEIEYRLPCPTIEPLKRNDNIEIDYLLGKQISNNFWVKSKLKIMPEDRKEYLICKGEGYTLTFDWLTKEQVQARLI